MIEIRGDLWELPADLEPCLRLITTNGETRKDGGAVMGRGCARQAKERLSGIEYKFGALLAEHGNRVMRLAALDDSSHLGTFPAKHDWKEMADLALIERSAHQLVELVEKFQYARIYLPRPGAGNGGREWSSEVKPVLEQILADDRFVIVSY